jgi:long-subunit acyl-CoA synthetase (AMP-forming)
MPFPRINALRAIGATLAAAAVALVIYSTSSSSEVSQTLEEAAKEACFKRRPSVRDLVERARAIHGATPDELERAQFWLCVGQEEAVLKEEVRRGLRPAFKGQAEQEAREAAERERASRPETDAEYFARTGFHYCDVRRGCNPAPMRHTQKETSR